MLYNESKHNILLALVGKANNKQRPWVPFLVALIDDYVSPKLRTSISSPTFNQSVDAAVA